jgi:signal transduction histidine kinase
MAFRVVQESLTNIRCHANANAVRVRLVEEGGSCRLEVIDDGVGFDPKATHGGYGLLGMEERAAALGATFEIISSTMQGTTVRVRTS